MRSLIALLGSALLAQGGCTVKGQGKSASPAWKVYKVEHERLAPAEPIRSGSMELRISKVFLEENKTVLATSHWVARIYGSIVGPRSFPITELSDAFTMIGKSGKVYKAHIVTRGPRRGTWDYQEGTSLPTVLPANVVGELEVYVQVGDDKTYDDLEAITFQGVRVPVGR